MGDRTFGDLLSRRTSEWLETDGLGGFASGTISGVRTRRYHALLLAALTPPTGRVVLVNGVEAWVNTPQGRFALSSHHYAPDVIHPDGARRIERFEAEPWPRWQFRLEDGTRIEHEIFVPRGTPLVAVSWRLPETRAGVTLSVRPLLSGRDYHALHRENPIFRFESEQDGQRVVWRPYDGLPQIVARSNGNYAQRPEWYRNFLYEEERARGLDFIEDLASPGCFHWDLSCSEAILILGAAGLEGADQAAGQTVDVCLEAARARAAEAHRRQAFPSRLHRAADAYLVRRGAGKTIVAGYPWFTDWGRDTFIALRGLCLAAGRPDEARQILIEWASLVSRGMLPNRLSDQDLAEFNAVDASLWFVIAVHDFFAVSDAGSHRISPRERDVLRQAVDAVLSGYARGTRYGIRADVDGLIAAGVPGVSLTWMDANLDGQAVTPRIGKPVEVEALWINALWIASHWSPQFTALFSQASEAFRTRFWNEPDGHFFDVIDVDHEPGKVDASFRPNQIFAVGGLPLCLVDRERGRRMIEVIEARLWTPIGIRTLAAGEPGYVSRYSGGVAERDRAYHQGSAWPWLLGPFVEAWIRVRGSTDAAKREARTRFLGPLLQHLDEAGIGHISEVVDGDPPHAPGGCPFQAWSVGEALRLDQSVLVERDCERATTSKRPEHRESPALPDSDQTP